MTISFTQCKRPDITEAIPGASEVQRPTTPEHADQRGGVCGPSWVMSGFWVVPGCLTQHQGVPAEETVYGMIS